MLLMHNISIIYINFTPYSTVLLKNLIMKYVILLVTGFLLFTGCNNKNNTVDPSARTVVKGTSISFDTKTFNFDTILFKKKAEYKFNFINDGEKPLVIYDVKTSCGCTVANFPKQPVKKGKSGNIKVEYDTKRIGAFNKTIRVYTNTSTDAIVLKIKGFVKDPDNSNI